MEVGDSLFGGHPVDVTKLAVAERGQDLGVMTAPFSLKVEGVAHATGTAERTQPSWKQQLNR